MTRAFWTDPRPLPIPRAPYSPTTNDYRDFIAFGRRAPPKRAKKPKLLFRLNLEELSLTETLT